MIVAQLVRRRVLGDGGPKSLSRLLATLQPLSLVALLATLVLLFGFQGEQIIAQPLIILMLAIPILIQVISTPGSPICSIAPWASSIASPARPR